MDDYMCEYCGQFLSSRDSFRRHLKTIHYSKTSEHKCSICGFKTNRLDSIRRHLRTNNHSKKAKDITTYILDFLDPPEAKALETSSYKADPSTTESYIYQQSMPKNKEMFPWVLQALDTTTTTTPRVYKPLCLLTKDPRAIPLEKQGQPIDPRIEDYPSTSPSWVDSSELSDLDRMLRAQLEETTTTSTTTEP